MSIESRSERGSTPLVDAYDRTLLLPIIREMIKRNPNDESHVQLIKSPDLVLAGTFSIVGHTILSAIEIPLAPIAKRIQKKLHQK